MRRLIPTIIVAILALPPGPAYATNPLPLTSEDAATNSGSEEGGVGPSPQALADDLAAAAKSHGWTVDEAAEVYRAGEVVGAIAEQIARERPDQFVGSEVRDPGEPPILYIKGPADDFVQELVASADIAITVADNQPFSFDELEARKLRVHHALEDLGYRYVAAASNITGKGVIPASVGVEPGLESNAELILERLPADIRTSVDLTVHPASAFQDFTAFGGMHMRVSGNFICTSGFSVRSISSGTPGISTAGHCTGLNEVVHIGHGVHSTAFIGQHRGQWGDMEWHTTPVAEPDDFYRDCCNIHDVSSIKPRGQIAIGNILCSYGRTSEVRDCSLKVKDPSQSCTNDGVFYDRLVLMNGLTPIRQGGDSGGPWYFGNQAWGLIKGRCPPSFNNFESFTVADLLDEALGVRVACGC